MDRTEFVYVTYISTTPERVWSAITDPEITRRYWQNVNISDWKPGSRWEHRDHDKLGTLRMAGKVVESDPPRRMVWTWGRPADGDKEDKHSRVTFDIEKVESGVVRLTVTHDRLDADPEMRKSISDGWPKVLSSLKTMLESGQPLPTLW